MLMRRIAAVVLGTMYLLQATWLLEGGVDLILERVVTVTRSDTGICCSGACGCGTVKKELQSCCCFPKSSPWRASASTPKTKVLLSALEESRCNGMGGGLAVLGSLPAIAEAPFEGFIPLAQSHPPAPILEPPHLIPDSRIDKVPI